MEVAGDDVLGDRGLTRRNLCQFICGLVVLARDVIELEVVEPILQAPYHFAISFHLGVMTA
jgi:hypothetical protein